VLRRGFSDNVLVRRVMFGIRGETAEVAQSGSAAQLARMAAWRSAHIRKYHHGGGSMQGRRRATMQKGRKCIKQFRLSAASPA
jgi:hypothetical protein